LADVRRTIEDRLRAEYFDLLPEIRRVAEQLEAEIRYHLLPLSKQLKNHERLLVTARVKDCESALQKLRRDLQGATFDSDHPEQYSLTSVKDLAGIRVLAFPRGQLNEIDSALRTIFHWNSDPVMGDGEEVLALKYYGYCPASSKIMGEYQIVSMLIGLFWEVEHSVMYKPDPDLRGVAKHPKMVKERTSVLNALRSFEEQFETLLQAGQNT
jgi:ppGpp synthetase/RelA/SpoT-type nucleotidyltranferase